MTIENSRIPSAGLFRLTGYDLYDYCDYCVGDFSTLESAIEAARARASEANAIPPSFSDVYVVYDHSGSCRFQITHEDLQGSDAHHTTPRDTDP